MFYIVLNCRTMHFHLKEITSSTAKADYAIEVLPESVFQHIASWLDTQPAEIQHEDLKAALLRTFCPSPSVHARRILDLPHQLPGDCSPTQAWHNINTLCQLQELDANTGPPPPKQLDLLKEIWLTWASPGFGRGGGQDFFFSIWKFACREATCCAWQSHALC